VKFYQELTVVFRPDLMEEVLDTAALPGQLTIKASGEVVCDQQADHLEKAPGISPEIDAAVMDLFQKAQAPVGAETRLLFQRLHIEQVPVFEVAYEYRGRAAQKLWVYGKERQMHAPGIPWARGKLFGLVLGIIILIAGSVWAFIQFGMK
jgi:hypothetical protein